MPITMPAGSEFYADSANQVTWILPGHAVGTPKTVIIDRKVSQFQNGVYSTPSTRIRVQEGLLDADGVPMGTKVVFDLNIRWPQGTTSTTMETNLAFLESILSDTNFVSELLVKQQLPRG